MPNKYKNHHDSLGQYLHWKICHHYWIKTAANWYGRHLEFVLEGRVRKTQANRPDLLLSNTEKKTIAH